VARKTKQTTNKERQNKMQPLNLNLNGVDTTPDRLQKGKYVMEIKEASFVESKNTAGNWNLLVVFATVQDETSQKGSTLSPGMQVRTYMPCQQSDNPKAPDFRVQLAKFLDGVYNTPEARPDLQAAVASGELVGKQLMVSVGFKEDETYGPSNEVKDFAPVVG
jgi:hypothetical protein